MQNEGIINPSLYKITRKKDCGFYKADPSRSRTEWKNKKTRPRLALLPSECANGQKSLPTGQAFLYEGKDRGKNMTYRKKRYGDRWDGRRIRSIQPMSRIGSYIMPTRVGSTNYIRDSVEVSAIERYIRKKRMQGMKGFGIMHIFAAAYVRVVSQKPGLNRYVTNRELYARDNITVSMVVKKEMKLDAQETVTKIEYSPYATANDVYEALNRVITESREEGDQSNFDDTARILNYVPRPVLRMIIALLRFLDNYNHMPRFLQKMSPFHASCFFTSMGSLGIPPVYHHLYEFGNCPIFISYGPKRTQFEMTADGTVQRRTYVDFTVTSDERICDGHYLASALKGIYNIFRHPEILDEPPETIVEDIE